MRETVAHWAEITLLEEWKGDRLCTQKKKATSEKGIIKYGVPITHLLLHYYGTVSVVVG